MESQTKDLALVRAEPQQNLPSVISPFSGVDNFASAQRMATLLAASTMVPEVYRGEAGVANCVVALEVSSRMGVSPLMLMQNMAIIEGRPALSAQFLIAMVNASRKFSPMRYKMRDIGPKAVTATVWDGPKGQRVKKEVSIQINDKGCRACARDLSNGEELIGPEVTLEMAIKEGWFTRNGSKWQTMPDVMLTYRAAAFFSRFYAPEMALGMHTTEEREDMRAGSIDVEAVPVTTTDAPAEVIPARTTRAPRAAKATVVDATPVAEAQPPTPPPAPAAPSNPPAAEPTTPPPPPAKPKNASTVTGVPRRQPQPSAPAAPVLTGDAATVDAWAKENGITMAELNGCLSDYMGEDCAADSVAKLTADQLSFAVANAPALLDVIKNGRV